MHTNATLDQVANLYALFSATGSSSSSSSFASNESPAIDFFSTATSTSVFPSWLEGEEEEKEGLLIARVDSKS